MLDRTAIDQLKSRVDLVAVAGAFTQLRKAGAEWAGPCPRCGGVDRFHVKTDGWFCRQCANDGDSNAPLWHDAIEFFQWWEGLAFADAVARIADGAPVATQAAKMAPAPKQAAKVAQGVDWQREAAQAATEAVALLASNEGAPGRGYLLGRGLQPATWERYGLGYAPAVALPGTWDAERRQHSYPKQPAIVLPWYRAGAVVGLRYRFLEKHTYTDQAGAETTAKQSARHGSQFGGVLYGGQAIDRVALDLRTLIITEGEINALSIAQAGAGSKLDVLSAGSETATITQAMIDYARQYGRTIFFVDRAEVARKWLRSMPFAHAIISPDGRDANDLLQAGELAALMAAWRWQAAQTDHERRRLLYDLLDAHEQGPGLDGSTLATVADMRARLGT